MAVRDVVQAAAGVGGDKLYVEDVFSTYLYEGTGSALTITNGIDLAGEGGLVWFKNRGVSSNHRLVDTERGMTSSMGGAPYLYTNYAVAEQGTGFAGAYLSTSTGFEITSGGASTDTNDSGNDYASWTFRKAPKFFDVVTYDGNSTAGRTVAHNLGSVPGMIIVKRLTGAGSNWIVYHKNLNGGTNPEQYYVMLNATNAQALGGTTVWNNTAPTSTEFTLGTSNSLNGLEESYVAYLFAHDAGGFGDDGEQNVISCGSYTGNGGNQSIYVGFEPQFVLIKNASTAGTNWILQDNMRGFGTTFDRGYGTESATKQLRPNTSAVESASSAAVAVTSTGFETFSGNGEVNGSGNTIIYIAIRRPMKTPESGTEVFDANAITGNGAETVHTTGFTVDAHLSMRRSSNYPNLVDRMRGFYTGTTNNTKRLATHVANAETSLTGNYYLGLDQNDGYKLGPLYENSAATNYIQYSLRRAPGFMDVVAYTGTNVGVSRTLSHNLTVPAELIITKARNDSASWQVYWDQQRANLNLAYGFSPDAYTPSTSTQFTVLQYSNTAHNHIAYLFASLPGVSKVGSYSGTGADLNVDCGFSSGARFILIKRTDSTGDWYVWDSVRGISAGNDPYLLLNSTTAEVTSTDYIDPLASGFTVTSSAPEALNASGGSYIFLAIA